MCLFLWLLLPLILVSYLLHFDIIYVPFCLLPFFLSLFFFFFKQKTAYEMRISDWSSDVCSSDLRPGDGRGRARHEAPDQFGPLHHLRDQLRLSRLCHQDRSEVSEGLVSACRWPEDIRQCRHLLGGQRRRHVSRGHGRGFGQQKRQTRLDRKSTRLNSSH